MYRGARQAGAKPPRTRPGRATGPCPRPRSDRARAGERQAVSETQLAVYAGSFDPATFGHLDLVERASQALRSRDRRDRRAPDAHAALHVRRAPRLLARGDCKHLAERRSRVVRGPAHRLRQAHRRARHRARSARRRPTSSTSCRSPTPTPISSPEIDTVFLPTRTNYGFISASLVREIASHGGDVSRIRAARGVRRAAREVRQGLTSAERAAAVDRLGDS